MKKARSLRLSIFCSIALAIAACTTDECLENQNALPLAGFYSSSYPSELISLDSISIYGLNAPGDSMMLRAGTRASSVYLPFRVGQPSTVYIVHYAQKGLDSDIYNDTLTFYYDAEPFFVSLGCGVSYRYHISGITTTAHIIDSVTCPSGLITNVNSENLRIYFRTDAPTQ